MKRKLKSLLATCLTICILIGLVPVTYAAETVGGFSIHQETTAVDGVSKLVVSVQASGKFATTADVMISYDNTVIVPINSTDLKTEVSVEDGNKTEHACFASGTGFTAVGYEWAIKGNRTAFNYSLMTNNILQGTDVSNSTVLAEFYFKVIEGQTPNKATFRIEVAPSELLNQLQPTDNEAAPLKFSTNDGSYRYGGTDAAMGEDVCKGALTASLSFDGDDVDALTATAINNKDGLTLAVPDAETGSAELQLAVTNTGLDGAYAGSDAKTTWSISGSNETGALLDAESGKLTITNEGSAGSFTVKASTTAGSVTKTDTATVTITKAEPVATKVEVSGAERVTVPTGENVTEKYTAVVTDQFGQTMADPAVVWSMEPADSTGISMENGTLTVTKDAAADGEVSVTVKATVGDVSGEKTVAVAREASVATSVEVSLPQESNTVTVPALNESAATVQATAVVKDQYGAVMQDADVQWTLENAPEGVDINDSGVITVNPAAQPSEGQVTVKATSGSVHGTAGFTVQRVASKATTVKLYRGDAEVGSADTLIIPASGQSTCTYTAKVFDQYGAEMQAAGMEWLFEPVDEKVTFADGTVTVMAGATKDRTYTLTATCEGKSASTTITVKDIEITWPTPVIKENPTYGDTWADIVSISGGSASINGTPVEGTFSVKNSTAYPGAGEQSYIINFTSTDGRQYNIDSQPKTVNVAPKAITVTVNPVSRAYGAANPTFDFTVPAGALVGEDTKEGLGVSLTTEATQESNVGSYAVTKAGQTTANYTVTVADNTALTITKADITGVSEPTVWTAILANDGKNATAEALLAAVKEGRTTLEATYANGTTTVSAEWKLTGGTWNIKGGEYTYTATLTPTDSTNFNTTSITKTLTVTVTPVQGTISWDIDALTKAKSEIASAGSITDVLGVTTVAVTYDNSVSDGPYTITGSEPTLETLKGYDVSAGDKTVEVVPTVAFPAWATIANADVLKTDLTITEKYPVKVTFTTEPTSVTYGEALATPVAEQTAINNGIDEDATFTYTYVGVDGTTYGPSTTAPTDAGTYQVTAALVSDTHSGSATSAKFTIEPKEVTLTWSGYEDLTYDAAAKNVTATTGNLVGDDVCTVTVTGGTETNAGTYTATATALSNANYKLPAAATQEYTIAKANRNLTVETADLLLYPGSLTGQITASTDTDLDKSAVITYTSGNTAAVTVNTAGKVNAVANGKVTVIVAIAATDNYNAAESKTVTVTALPKPLTSVNVAGDEGDKLTAELVDGKIVVSGIKAAASELTVTPVTATVDGVSITSQVADNTLTLKVGETVIATYAIDTTNVTELDANVTLEDEGKTSDNEVQGDKAAAAEGAVSDPATKTDGLVESAAKALNDAAQALAESKKAEIETAFGEGEAYTIKVEPSVKFTAKVLDDNTFRLAIEPVYTVTAVKTNGGDKLVLAADVAMPNSALTTPVTVSVKLPDGFPKANLFARHYLSSGGTETLRVNVSGDVATWKQSSFSEVELFADNRGGSIQFHFADGSQETKTYDVADLNTALPTDSKSGYTFQGWTINGKTYKTLTEELLSDLNSTVVTAEPAFQANSSGGGSGGGSSGGGSSTVRYTITVKQSDGGKIAPETTKVKKGENQTFTITADKDYVIADVLVDGKSVGAVGTYTFKNVTATHTIQAVFEKQEAPAFQFSDVNPNGWAAESIYFLYDRGVVSGVGDNLFAPTRNITRAEFVRMLAGLSGVTAEELSGKTTDFTDVVSGSWYEPYVAWAVENGVTSGTSETTFAPNANITREQMATMIYRYAGNVDFTLPETEPAVTFSDASSFSGWAVDAIGAMQRAGIISGVGDNRFAPADNATREQACRMLAVFLQLMEK